MRKPAIAVAVAIGVTATPVLACLDDESSRRANGVDGHVERHDVRPAWAGA
jgi:hypothetical protein